MKSRNRRRATPQARQGQLRSKAAAAGPSTAPMPSAAVQAAHRKSFETRKQSATGGVVMASTKPN